MKKTIEEKLEDALNINSEIIEYEEKAEVVKALPTTQSHADDFEAARNNIASLIAKGEEAVDGILHLAKEAEHPRAYEVASTLIKTMVEANKDLLELHKKKKELEKEDYEGPRTQVQNNTVFVGSTKELQKHLLDLAKSRQIPNE